jgi:hypothetical protein
MNDHWAWNKRCCYEMIINNPNNRSVGVEIGQLYVIKPVFSIDCGGLGALFLSHYFVAVKGFFALVLLTWKGRQGAPARMGPGKLVGAGALCC